LPDPRRLFGAFLGALSFAAAARADEPGASGAGLELVQAAAPSAPALARPSSGGNVIVPIVVYTPETHIGLGALFAHLFRTLRAPEARTSSIGLVGLITTRRQAVFEVHPDVYLASDDLHLFGKFEYQHYPDSFFGVGNDGDDDEVEERYERDRLRMRPVLQHRLTGQLYAGVLGDAMRFDPEYLDPNGIFAREDVPGERGGVTVGLGPTLTLDTRDNTLAPHEGALITGNYIEFLPNLGSRYAFRKFQADARFFVPLGDQQVLGLHLYGEAQGKNVPYYHLAMLGGDELLRGYYLGRFRDKNLLALDLEFRTHVYWRFGAVAFAGAGRIGSELGALTVAPLRWTVGTGVRYALTTEERLNLRLDFGIGPDTRGLYFTAREAF
jgi:hypothetical protein